MFELNIRLCKLQQQTHAFELKRQKLTKINTLANQQPHSIVHLRSRIKLTKIICDGLLFFPTRSHGSPIKSSECRYICERAAVNER